MKLWWVRVDDWSPGLCTWGLNNVVELDQYIPSGPTSIRSQTALRISFRNMPNFGIQNPQLQIYMVHARSLIYGGHISEPTAPRDLLIMSQFFSAYLTARRGPTKYWPININDDPNPYSNLRQLEYVLLIAAGPGWPTWDRWDRLQPNYNPDGLMDGWTFRQSKKIIIHIFIN